jgi:hypothetical protein
LHRLRNTARLRFGCIMQCWCTLGHRQLENLAKTGAKSTGVRGLCGASVTQREVTDRMIAHSWLWVSADYGKIIVLHVYRYCTMRTEVRYENTSACTETRLTCGSSAALLRRMSRSSGACTTRHKQRQSHVTTAHSCIWPRAQHSDCSRYSCSVTS